MDVNRIGNGYQPAQSAPTPGSGEFAPAPPASASVESSRSASGESSDILRRAVNEINSAMATHGRHLGIRHHEPTNRRIVTVYDSDSNEVIREIPPERVLEAHANMLEMAGLLVDTLG
jgi:flagellar protein FlaG